MHTVLIGAPGVPELLLILLIVVVVFGASRLPMIGEGLGKAISGFKRGMKTDDDIEVTPSERRVTSDSEAQSVERAVEEADVVER